ncbi:MAG: hypothetical protein H7Z14_12135 [Anaerolineae bacterium]|nr:hypothetical protein [Phycisphaerae bacterium]
MGSGENVKTVKRLGWFARLIVVASFFVMWKQFDVPAIEALKYSVAAFLVLHALLRVLRPIARVFDRARTRGMIVVGILKFLVSLALPALWKGLDVPFWKSLLICGVIYFALDRVWRVPESRATRQSAIGSGGFATRG